MKFLILVKATQASETGSLPDANMFAEMGRYNQALSDAGILLAGEGLHPSSRGARVRFSGAERTVREGPFEHTSELVAGYWLWEVESLQKAIEWVKRCPNPMPTDSEIEIRPIVSEADFAELLAAAQGR